MKTKAKPPKQVLRLAVLIEGTGLNASKVLVRQRPETGLLARMWELPHIEVPDSASWAADSTGSLLLEKALADEGLQIQVSRQIGEAQHIFTHLVWNIRVLAAVVEEEQYVTERTSYQWVGPKEFENYVWPNVFRKLLTEYYMREIGKGK